MGCTVTGPDLVSPNPSTTSYWKVTGALASGARFRITLSLSGDTEAVNPGPDGLTERIERMLPPGSLSRSRTWRVDASPARAYTIGLRSTGGVRCGVWLTSDLLVDLLESLAVSPWYTCCHSSLCSTWVTVPVTVHAAPSASSLRRICPLLTR